MPWGVAAAVGGAYLSSQSSKKAAQSAANAQTQSSDAAIAQQNKQFEALQKMQSPFVNAGTGALGAQQSLLGLNGYDAQQSAIGGIQNGAQFQALNQQGQNSILQNSAATGGLRGGNTQAALAQFSPQLLQQLIQQQYSNLGGITSIGQNAAAGVGNAGMSNANSISGLLQSQGSARAGAALATGQANNQLYNSLGSTFGNYF
ncbi:hypothetical protein [Pseudomonas sp.]|uniref:hypothetical protein n=1 Tax=Pseudomonas sp. TaxID=306 RepID=UPI003FD7206B